MKKIIAKNFFLGLISGLAFSGVLLLLMLITQPVSSVLVFLVLGGGLFFGLAMSVYLVVSTIRSERSMDKGHAYLENLDETFPPCKMIFQGSLQYKPGVECPMRIWFFEDHFVVVYLRSRKASVFEFAYADVSDAYVVHDAFSFVCKDAHFSVVLDASDSELEALHRFTVDCGIGPKG